MSDEIEERLIPIGGRVVGQHRRRLDDGRHANEIARHAPASSLESAGEIIAAIAEVRAEPEVNIHPTIRLERNSLQSCPNHNELAGGKNE